MAKKTRPTDRVVKQLRKIGLGYPGAHLKSPWPNHKDLAVKDKTFCYLSPEGRPFSISCKLPASGFDALLLPFTEPTGYGLGRSGWVTATFEPGEQIPVGLLQEWLEESYRAQAPKRLLAQLDGGDEGGSSKPTKKKVAGKKKVAAKKKAATKKRAVSRKKTPAKKKAPARKRAASSKTAQAKRKRTPPRKS